MKFQIGQRVTIARPSDGEMIGRQATVLSGIEKFKTEKGLWVTGHWIEIDGIPDTPFVAEASELDPVLAPVFVDVDVKQIVAKALNLQAAAA